MALSFRFLWLLFLSYFRPDRPVGELHQKRFLLLPFVDCEFAASLNAAQYFRLAERVQQEANSLCGFTRDGIRLRMWAITLSNTIYYRRPLRCFERISVTSQLIGWNEKHWVWENRFSNHSGQLAALSYTKVAVFSRQGIVSPQEAFRSRGLELVNRPFPAHLTQLFEQLEMTLQPEFNTAKGTIPT